MSQEYIMIIDFGSQYREVVARRIRENNVYSEVVSYKNALKCAKENPPKGIIFTGGPNSVYEKNSPQIEKEIFQLGIPVLGICYGAQLMAHTLGGKVEKQEKREYGKVKIKACNGGDLTGMFEEEFCWMSHTDQIVQLPEGFVVTATSETCPFAAMECKAKGLYAVQFHPEVEHTPFGRQLFYDFTVKVCGCKQNWTSQGFIDTQINEIKQTVGDKNVLCALSGGVDSTVAAVLVHRAIGERLTCVFVDHGFMRKDEGDMVMDTLEKEFEMKVIRVNAKDRFMAKLAGVTEPEEKRKIIGAEFIKVFDEQAALLEEQSFLLQGTIYPDVIESGTDTAHVIKSHHNVGGLPKDVKFKLLEPLRPLFKDEVRKVGAALGIPKQIVNRQPFPGPGLAIRTLGELTDEKVEIVRESDAILRQEIAKAGLDGAIWQYFTVLPNIRSVGVMGDVRTYAHVVAIRAVTSTDGMTSDWAKIPYEVLEKISSRIVNEVNNVSRIVYDITTKPPSTIEWE
ncbi:MAG: glutamine-hydrolyzing GMP synthase [Oscillospiraceae bacterium]